MTCFFERVVDSGVQIIITTGRFWIMSKNTVTTISKRIAKVMGLTRWLHANLVHRCCNPRKSNDTRRGLDALFKNWRRNMPRFIAVLPSKEGHKSISELD